MFVFVFVCFWSVRAWVRACVCEHTQGQTPPWDVIYEWSRLDERALNSRLNVTYLGKRTLCHCFVAIIGPILGLTSNVTIRTDIKIMYWSTHFVIKGGWFGCPLISYPRSLPTTAVKIGERHIVDNEDKDKDWWWWPEGWPPRRIPCVANPRYPSTTFPTTI